MSRTTLWKLLYCDRLFYLVLLAFLPVMVLRVVSRVQLAWHRREVYNLPLPLTKYKETQVVVVSVVYQQGIGVP